MNLEGKVAIITGSGRGIGKQTAIRLAKEGCNVIICSRTKSEINAVVREINSTYNNKAIGLLCNVKNLNSVRKLVNRIINKFGRIDILVNNAGIVILKPLVETKEKEWDDVIDTNLKGVFLFTKEVLPHMIKQKHGVIVNVSSGAGKYGFPNLSVYCASKFGLIGLGESVAKEIKKYEIKIYTICPGPVSTRMHWENLVGKNKFKIVKYTMIKPEKIAQKIYDLIFKPSINSGECLEVYY